MIGIGQIELEAQLRQMEQARKLDVQHTRKRAQDEIVRVVRPRFVQSEFFTRRFGMFSARTKTQPA